MSEHDLLVSPLNEKVTALLHEVAVLKRENRKLKKAMRQLERNLSEERGKEASV